MTWYLYPPMPAIGANGEIVRSGTGQFFAEDDAAGTTPLTLQDINGATITSILVNDLGLTQAFRSEHPEGTWRSGPFTVSLSSPKGLREAADASALAAAESADAATVARNAALEAAAGADAIPAGGAVGQVLTKASLADKDVTWTTPSGGGGGGGVTVHGGLTGLDADDHLQYLTPARGDARYYQKAQVDTAVAAAATATSAADRSRANHTGVQPISSVENLETRLAAVEAGGGGGGGTITTDSVTDMTTVGKAVAKASSAAAARTAIGAGTSSVVIGTVGGTAADAGTMATALSGKAGSAHTHAAADVTGLNTAIEDIAEPLIEGMASELGDQAVARTVYGSHEGEILPPWNTAPAIGPERWLTANMHASGAQVLAPTITANGSPQEVIVYLKMDSFNNAGVDPWRLEFDFEAPASGWASVYLALQQSNQTNVAGTADQYVVTHESPARSGHSVVDFQVPDFNTSFMYLKVRLKVENNVTAGQILRLTNVSLRRIPRLTPPMLVAYGFSPGAPTLWMRHTNSRGVRKTTKTLLNEGGIASTLEYDTWSPWRWSLPDPSFIDATGVYDGKVGSDETKTGIAAGDLNVGNNDQILSVETSTPGTFELRGNVHGGETAQAGGIAYKIDEGKGAGLVTWTPGSSLSYLKPCRRYQVKWNTQLTRSGDSTPFALVDHLSTAFDDGMIRTDRSTTFPKAAVIGDTFEWMSSHAVSPLWLGRIGKGQTVISDLDTRGLLAAPVQPAATPSTTGGTLAAGTYYYWVTAMTEVGETTVSPVRSATTTGSTGSVALTWTNITGAIGYRVYRGNASTAVPRLIGSSQGGAFTDTGAGGNTGAPTQPTAIFFPPKVNTARTTTATRREATATDATWSVWYDPQYDMCYANIFDRDALLSRAGVQAATTRLQMIPGSITKEYINAIWTGNTGTIAVGTSTPAWVATHWSYIYSPNDLVNFHREVADKAANLGALKAMYPAV